METKKLVRVALFAALTAVGAYLAVPIQPVPFTMQPFFVLLSGVILGGNLGALSQLVYVLIGIAGIPVFAQGQSGIGVVMGPTGGFLVGFIIASFVIGKMVEAAKGAEYFWILLSMLVGLFCLYGAGVLWLGHVAHLTLPKAFAAGGAPFITFDVLKAVIAAYVGLKLRKALQK